MGLKANICRVCGGALKNCGTYYKCVCCDTEYRIDDSMTKAEVEAYFDRLNDFADAERNLSVAPPRFDEAESEFSLIVQKYPDWSAGYWGLVRAKFGIKFERDLSGKAVPSCYKSTYEDFRDTDEYKKAVALAETPELRQSYEKMAEYIARVAKEWRAEAQKYDYDVFISFKASNDLDGSETRDAREMHKLYDLLKDKGYRVFFSPVTLLMDGVGGKGSEPYIFNALDKAKALIVYGSKKEYFSSTWVQNEWQRYLRAIKVGKKGKDSLLVLYEGFNPKELPQGLRRIQGIEYGISAYPAVLFALERVFRNKEEAARDREQELRRAEEKKRKAEQENAQKMQDMMAQLAAMQAELARLRSESVLKTTVFGPYYGQDESDFQIVDGMLVQYRGEQKNVIVPDIVTSIGFAAFEGCSELTSITIPNSVTEIWDAAFEGCSGLTSITIPNSVMSIGNSAFEGCGGLTSITIPNSVTRIGDNAFEGCCRLTSIKIPNSVIEIGDSAFEGCIELTSIEILDSVMSIGKDAFKDCAGLSHITVEKGNQRYYSAGDCIIDKCYASLILGCKNSIIPADGSIMVIGKGAFSGCSGLTNITIPNSVTSIGDGAFWGCSGLTNIMIPNSVTSIGDGAFWGCSGLMSITVDQENEYYFSEGNCLIERESVALIGGCKNSVIPAGIWGICKGAFNGCSGLTSIMIPRSVNFIELSAFVGCSGLTSITVDQENEYYYSEGNCIIERKCENLIFDFDGGNYIMEEAGKKLILGCKNSIIPADGSVKGIYVEAFADCSGLTSIIIPNSVTSIEDGAFSGCCRLTSITIPDSVTSIGDSAFAGCSGLTGIPIPNSVTSIGDGAFKGCSALMSITIPNSVTRIGNGAFAGCSRLTSITIPNSVTRIGNGAFKGCNALMSITIPNSVTSIGDSAFAGCSALTSVTMPNEVTYIGDQAFRRCSKLKEVIVPHATEIAPYAFDKTNIVRK